MIYSCFLALNFVKISLPKSFWCPKSKVDVNVLNVGDNMEISDLLKGNMSSVEIGGH
jgi:hypothetical protein